MRRSHLGKDLEDVQQAAQGNSGETSLGSRASQHKVWGKDVPGVKGSQANDKDIEGRGWQIMRVLQALK